MKKVAIILCLLLSACAQGLSVKNDTSRESVADRRCKDAENDDGEYVFYFKNGKNIVGDCDGYTATFNGKTVIYEYFRAGINSWEKKLKDAGVPANVTKTSNPFRYNSIRFDTSLLKGVGLESKNDMGTTTIYKNDKKFKLGTYCRRAYIDSNKNVHIDIDDDYFDPGADVDSTVKGLQGIGANVLATHWMELDVWRGGETKIINSYVIIAPEDILFHQSLYSGFMWDKEF